jgi:predicted deacylase
VATRADGSIIGIPVVVINGEQPGPVLVVDAGAHGDEQEGTMAVFQLLQALDPAALRGTVVAVPVLHIPAMEALHRTNPTDHWQGDLNRVFPGNASGNLSQRVAEVYSNVIVAQADLVVSLHSGASYLWWSPMVAIGPDAESLALSKLLGPGWNLLSRHDVPGGSAREACAARGVPQITIEIGGAGDRYPYRFAHHTGRIVDAILNLMRHKGMIDGAAQSAESWTVVRTYAVRSGRAGMLAPARELNVRGFVRAGTPLMDLLDVFGERRETVVAPTDGYVMAIRTYQYAPPGWPIVWMGEPIHDGPAGVT